MGGKGEAGASSGSHGEFGRAAETGEAIRVEAAASLQFLEAALECRVESAPRYVDEICCERLRVMGLLHFQSKVEGSNEDGL